jgi:coatomer subunit beta
MSGTPENSNESYCTFTLAGDVTAGGLPSEADIRKDLEDNDPKVKKHALKAAIMAMLGGEAMPSILMQVIRFCINSQDKQLKKLCMLYWEVVPKYQEPTSEELHAMAMGGQAVQRKLLPEMILVCNALLNDLNHPNEYVRGGMLRFLCKVKDEEILSPLVASIKACLTHKHPYVRKNAALAVFHAHKLFGEHLIPDAPELIQTFLLNEQDTAARRNAFLMLFNSDEAMAIEFLAQNMDDVGKYGDGFALLVLDLTRRVCRRDPQQKSRFVRVLLEMLSSNSPAVSYEAAWTLVSLSSAPTAIRAAAMTYTNLLTSQNDNNVKMIVLERLDGLKLHHTKILQELLMDILRALSSPNPDICKKVLDVALDIVNVRNVSEVVNVLKREVTKVDVEANESKGANYRGMLIRAIHGCAVRFPVVAESVVHVLMDFLSTDSAIQVIIFVRAIMEQYPPLRASILNKLLYNFDGVKNSSVMCVCLWIMGEYCDDASTLREAFEGIAKELGEANFVLKNDEKQAREKAAAAASAGPKIVTKNVILSDGTYATQTVYSEPKKIEDNTPPLRKMLIEGDVFLGSVLASTLTKLCLRAKDMPGDFSGVETKKMTMTTCLIMCAIVKMAEITVTSQKSSLADCSERITMCTRALLDPKIEAILKPILIGTGKQAFSDFLKTLKDKEAKEAKKNEKSAPLIQADDLIHFRQLRSTAVGTGEIDLDDGSDLARATGYQDGGSLLSTELSHVYQLSGFADPVYAEASVTVRDYDISLDLLVINRTPNPLTNLNVELNTMGDMKIVERPQSQSIGPLDQINVRASIKVSSTETGHIFGTIVYDDATTKEKHYINLNDIHMDIMDYIRPASCTDELFRSMWAEFEWENKVAINTNLTDIYKFLDHIVKSTKMKCLTPHDKSQKGTFLAANLYARSVFGEDVLVNLSVEKKEDKTGELAGYIRIRAKTQGIALSLGDRITSVQRTSPDRQ